MSSNTCQPLSGCTSPPGYISRLWCSQTRALAMLSPGFQDVKKAVLEDMTAVGKEAGLKSFEQVCVPGPVCCTCGCGIFIIASVSLNHKLLTEPSTPPSLFAPPSPTSLLSCPVKFYNLHLLIPGEGPASSPGGLQREQWSAHPHPKESPCRHPQVLPGANLTNVQQVAHLARAPPPRAAHTPAAHSRIPVL